MTDVMFDAPSSQKKTFKLTLDYAKSKLEKQEKEAVSFCEYSL